MKFISKAANLNIILRPGMQAQPLTGSPAIATIFVKFKDGIAEVEQEELVEMMMRHPGFNMDFIAADDKGTDPYADRREHEVEYVTEELTHGQAKRVGTPVRKVLPPEIKRMITEQATAIAKEMLPEMVKAVLASASQGVNKPVLVEEVVAQSPSSLEVEATSKVTPETVKAMKTDKVEVKAAKSSEKKTKDLKAPTQV